MPPQREISFPATRSALCTEGVRPCCLADRIAKWPVFALFSAAVVAAAGAQEPVRPDTVGSDSAQVRQLPELNVTVTRSAEPLQKVPYAVGTLNRGDLQRGQQTLGIDEALNNLPGVVVSNRYNFSLDQRISIRGFGSRSNFGVRGLKILLDGVPQTLPDGQSQLTDKPFATRTGEPHRRPFRYHQLSIQVADGKVVARSTARLPVSDSFRRVLQAFGPSGHHPSALREDSPRVAKKVGRGRTREPSGSSSAFRTTSKYRASRNCSTTSGATRRPTAPWSHAPSSWPHRSRLSARPVYAQLAPEFAAPRAGRCRTRFWLIKAALVRGLPARRSASRRGPRDDVLAIEPEVGDETAADGRRRARAHRQRSVFQPRPDLRLYRVCSTRASA